MPKKNRQKSGPPIQISGPQPKFAKTLSSLKRPSSTPVQQKQHAERRKNTHKQTRHRQ
jgi:hypothetical protein